MNVKFVNVEKYILLLFVVSNHLTRAETITKYSAALPVLAETIAQTVNGVVKSKFLLSLAI